MCMRASELRKFWHFTFLNCYFFQYFVGTSDTLLVQMTCLSAYMYRQISKYQQTLTLSKCMCMRASELRKCWHFTFLNCYFFQYFVGTPDILSVQMTCLSAYMYRQISKCTDKFSNVPTKLRKSIIGGGGGAVAPPAPPPPPLGYANDAFYPADSVNSRFCSQICC